VNAAGEDVTASYSIKYVNGTLAVTRKTVSVTTGSAEKGYDGTALTNTEARITGLADGETAAVTATGSQTEVGSSDNTYDIDWGSTDKDNYEIVELLGTLTVTVNTDEITLTAASDSKPYDGTALTNPTVTATGLPEGFTIEATASGSQTKAGSSDNIVNAGYRILDAEGNDKTANFANIKVAKGTLTVTQKDITFTANSDTKVYDGTALENNGSTNTGLADGDDVVSVTVKGSQTLVGSSENVASEVRIVNAEGEDVTDSYNITYAKGTLTVTDGTPDEPVDDKLVVTKSVDDETYALGQTVTFEVTATNIYAEARTITLSEIEGVTLEQSVFENVVPGETVSTTASYKITEADLLNGSFTNTVTAEVGNITKKASAAAETEKANSRIKVTKETISKADAANGRYVLGEEIRYRITVRNTGNVTLKNINVSDSLVRFKGKTGRIASLAPGKTATLTYDYTVTAANVAAGEVVNTATARGTAADGTTPAASDSVTVRTQDTPGGGGGNPGGGPDGGGPGITPAAPDEGGTVVPDEPVPEVEPEVEPEIDIDDPDTPLAEGAWALINLICAILTALGAIVALFRRKEEDDEDEDEQNKPKTDEEEDENDNRGRKMLAAKIAGAIAGVAGPVAFILTEDMTLPMEMVDKWTLLMVVILAAQIIAAIFNKKASELDDEEEEAEATN